MPLWTLQRLQLPIANTVFQNGFSSTLLAQRWMIDETSNAEIKMQRIRNVRLPQQTLDLSKVTNSSPIVVQQMPLTAITHPRTVAISMGNIIKRFSDSDSGDFVPASTELEESVSAWTNSQDYSGQRVMVWALVTPLELQKDNYESGQVSLQSAITSGSRLHKVLSGGGGWGEKKGLLALDPDTECVKTTNGYASAFEFERDSDDVQAPSFGEVVRPGDVVTFYVYDQGYEVEQQSEDVSLSKHQEASPTPSVIVATIPPTIDDLPSPRLEDAGRPPLYAENHLGLASEALNLTIKGIVTDSRSEYDSVHNDSVVQTKIDVPFAKYSIGYGAPSVLSGSPPSSGKNPDDDTTSKDHSS